MKRFFSLSAGDIKNIYRDSMQLLVAAAPLFIMAVLRFGVPMAASLLKQHFGFELSAHYSFMLSLFLTMPPLMYGMVIGFLMLDERDDGLLAYFAVTPLSKSGYLRQRVLLPVVVSFLMILILVYGSGLSTPSFIKLLPVALLTSLESPLLALAIVSTAANKVEGLAIAKGLGITIMAPFAGYLWNSDWKYLVGVIPQFWVSQAFMGITDNHIPYGLSVLAGLAVHFGYIAVLMRIFKQKME